MTRLNFVVEGQTEETFVRDVLAPHLLGGGIACAARCVQTGRKRGKVFKGGVTSYVQFHKDLTLWMKQDQGADAYFTTMVDLYRLPDDFPGHQAASKMTDPLKRVAMLEESFRQDVAHHLGQFIPHIQSYEFEALLFAGPEVFALSFPGREREVDALRTIRAEHRSPEHIDDEDPPSRRILSVFRGYDKVSDGPLLASEIGLQRIRQECQHFGQWVRRLEEIGQRN